MLDKSKDIVMIHANEKVFRIEEKFVEKSCDGLGLFQFVEEYDFFLYLFS